MRSCVRNVKLCIAALANTIHKQKNILYNTQVRKKGIDACAWCTLLLQSPLLLLLCDKRRSVPNLTNLSTKQRTNLTSVAFSTKMWLAILTCEKIQIQWDGQFQGRKQSINSCVLQIIRRVLLVTEMNKYAWLGKQYCNKKKR